MTFPGDVNVTFRAITDEYIQGVRGARNENKQFGLEVNQVGGRLPAGYQQGTKAVDQYASSVQRATIDTKGLTLSMVGLGTTIIGITAASSRLDFAQNRLAKTQVAVRRIEDQIASTQKNLNRLIEQGKTNTEDYAVQVQRLETAYADLETKQEDVKLAQTALNDTQLLFATTIANTAINSLFLMKSAFSGLSLAQIKTSLTTSLFTNKVAFSGAVAQLGSVKVGLLTKATHAFGTALKTALPPLLIIGGALAAWELAVAPLIKQHHDLDLSIQGMMDSAFGAGDAMTDLGNDAKKYKELMGESTEATDSQADALRELFGLVENKDNHPMIAFWNRQIFLQKGVIENIGTIKREMNDPSMQQALDFQAGSQTGAVVTQSTGNGSSTGGTWTGARGGGARTQAESQAVISETVSDTIVQTEDKKLDQAIADSTLKAWKEGKAPTFKDVFGHSLAEEFPEAFEAYLTNEFGLRGFQMEQLRTEGSQVFSFLQDPVLLKQLKESGESGAKRLAELQSTLAKLKQTYGERPVEALRASLFIERELASGASQQRLRFLLDSLAPSLGANITNIFEEALGLPKAKSLSPLDLINPSNVTADQSSGFNVTTALLDPERLREMAEKSKSEWEQFGNIAHAREAVRLALRADVIEAGLDPFFHRRNQGINRVSGGIGGFTINTLFSQGISMSQGSFGFDMLRMAQLESLGVLGMDQGRRRMGSDRPRRRTNIDFVKEYMKINGLEYTATNAQEAMEFFNNRRSYNNAAALVSMGAVSSVPEYLGTQRISDEYRFGAGAVSRGQVSVSEVVGGAIRFRERNRKVLAQRRAELAARDAFVNSREGAIERIRAGAMRGINNIIAIMTGGTVNYTPSGLTRSQSNALQRNPIGEGLREEIRLAYMDVVGEFAIRHVAEKEYGDPELADVILDGRPASEVFGTGMHIRKAAVDFLKNTGAWQARRFFNLPGSATPSLSPRLAAIRSQKAGNIMRLVPRLGEFLIRSSQGRPITVDSALQFARGILDPIHNPGVKYDPQFWRKPTRLERTLEVLGTSISEEFYTDNIDTRNEVLELEARAYFIEREERSSLA